MRYENATTTQATSNLAANQIGGMTDTMPSLTTHDNAESGTNLVSKHRRAEGAKASLDSNAVSEAPLNFTDQAGITIESQPAKSDVIEVEQVDANLESDAGVTTTKQIKMDTIEEAGENEIDDELSDGDEDITIFVESKYCTLCHLEMPLRTKHCKKCDYCVATHDHHCPWIGNCVGERNKARFYYYLIVQHI